MTVNIVKRALVISTVVTAFAGSDILLAPSAEAVVPMKTLAYDNAKAHIGDPYVYGAKGPNKFDCSGLIHWNYTRGKTYKTKWEKNHPNKSFPRTAQAQYNYSKKVAKKNRSVGDLVFFYDGGGVYHVGYYYGWKYRGKTGGFVLHAPRSNRLVRIEKIWTSKVKYGRIN